ncbi:NAD-dependent epimerase/dehydratase [Flavobacterium sp. 17A]|uniref:NAD-dependent epimerase/dehydratase n=1 Tax=Flavobacterium potami TaxID=2872310 RepID=A0A9X1KR29_9FLAO|nr:NAD-dependent epimerase/dehydratase [Flavobacterium potami]MBZ4036533.1 NAD-dependent epimerase/dehydratase [Flavobacterium potami]
MSNHILITGGTGYLGSHIIKELLSKNYEVSVLIREKSSTKRLDSCAGKLKFIDITNLEAFFVNRKVDGIIHIATNYGRKGESVLDVVNSNLYFPIRLLEFAIQNKVDYFINTDTSLPKNINPYSLSKAHFRDWLSIIPSEMKIINVIPEYFYGPNDDETKFITGMLHKFFRNEESIDLSEGIQKRDFIYIDDVVSAYMCLIENLNKIKHNTNIQLGSALTISLKNLVLLLKEMSCNRKTVLNFGKIPMRKDDVLESKADVSYLLQLGWKPKISLEDGIRKIIELENLENK